MQTEERPLVQPLETRDGNLIDSIKRLVHEGNVRKISIKQDGHPVAEFPLTFGVVGAALAPALAAIGAITALLTDCTIEVEHAEPPSDSPTI
jgi:Domain of unknown function (DUF4342)